MSSARAFEVEATPRRTSLAEIDRLQVDAETVADFGS